MEVENQLKKLNKAESLVEDISQGLDVIEKQRDHLEREIEQMNQKT